MLKGAKREHKTVMEIAKYYTDAFFADCEKLNIKRPDIVGPIILQDFRKSIFFTAFIQLFPENIDAHPDPADRKTDQQRLGNAGQRP